MNGDGLAVVIRTGDSTVLGKICRLTLSVEKRDPQFKHELMNFERKTSTVAVVATVVLFIYGIAFTANIKHNIGVVIGILVSFVPLGRNFIV